MKNPLTAGYRAWQNDRRKRRALKAERDLARVEEQAPKAHQPPGPMPPFGERAGGGSM
jgi:hypothetical protein